MPLYRVSWEIDMDAPDAETAARKALAVQRKLDSLATVFYVQEHDPNKEREQIDLTALDEGSAP